MDSEEWEEVCTERGAIWSHDGNPKRPHAVLTSGLHSGGFFDASIIMRDPGLADNVGEDIRSLMPVSDVLPFREDEFDLVLGPAMGAITLAYAVARAANYEGMHCEYGWAVKKDGVWVTDRTEIVPGTRVLLVEDTLTTGKSVMALAAMVTLAGGIVQPYIAAIMNRSGQTHIGGKLEIISLMSRDWPTYEAEKCPLCKAGSEPLRPPKDPVNWAKLNANY